MDKAWLRVILFICIISIPRFPDTRSSSFARIVKAAIAARAVNPKLHKLLDEEVPQNGRIKQVTNAEEKIIITYLL